MSSDILMKLKSIGLHPSLTYHSIQYHMITCMPAFQLLEAVVIKKPSTRALSGKISLVTTWGCHHINLDLFRRRSLPHGPYEQAKKNFEIQTKAIKALFADYCSGKAAPTEATMIWYTLVPIAPNSRSGHRPHLSTKDKPGTVDEMLATDVMTESYLERK